MSNISNTHQFIKLEKNTTALSGQRLVRLIAKGARGTGDKNPHLTESLAVSIPTIQMEDVVNVIDQLIPHVIAMLGDTQDKIIREWRLESGRDEVHDNQISIAACIEWLNENSTGERVTREYLGEWFTSEYASLCNEWISVVSGGQLSEIVRDQKTNLMRDMIAGWASPKYSPNIPSLKAQLRFMNHCADNEVADLRMNSIITKATAMLTKKENELSEDALGF